MIALEYFRMFAPAFSSTSDQTVLAWLSIATEMVAADCATDKAVAPYAAHLMQVTASAGESVGAVTAEKEGDLSRSYGELRNSEDWLGTTSYGQLFLELTRACVPTGALTRIGLD
jgi:hypothetical protein